MKSDKPRKNVCLTDGSWDLCNVYSVELASVQCKGVMHAI